MPELYHLLMSPHIQKVDVVLSPGLTVLRWTSQTLKEYLPTSYKALNDLEQLIDTVNSIHKNRIQKTFSTMLATKLYDIPEQDVITIEEFEVTTSKFCQAASTKLETQSLIVEKAVRELIELLLGLDEDLPSELPEDFSKPGSISLTRKIELRTKLLQDAELLRDYYQQQNIDTLVQLFRSSLDTIRKKVAVSNALAYGDVISNDKHRPLFVTDVILALPTLVIRPSLEEVQQGLNRAVHMIVDVPRSIYCWGQERPSGDAMSIMTESSMMLAARSRVRIDSTMPLQGARSHVRLESRSQVGILGAGHKIKTYYHSVSEHKEIVKLVTALGSSLSSTKSVVQSTINQFNQYQHLWAVDRDKEVAKFTEGSPGVSDYQQEMHHYAEHEDIIRLEPDVLLAGALQLHTDQLKGMLSTEAKQWRVALGRAMSQYYQGLMDRIFQLIEEWTKMLARPLKDLDDVRSVMASLKDIRDKEIFVDMSLEPIEVHGYKTTGWQNT